MATNNNLNILKLKTDLFSLSTLVTNYLKQENKQWLGNDAEFIRQWSQYKQVRDTLIQLDTEFFGQLRDISLPEPDKSNQYYAEHGMYFGHHLEPLKNELELALGYFQGFEQSQARQMESNEDKEPSEPYVSEKRINELRNVKSTRFDLSKLIRLCEELNVAHYNRSFMSIAMIGRAIIDHIPPIFSVKSLSEISTYSGAQSFKESVAKLNDFLRKIADSHLHVRIRSKEVLPEFPQVDFRQPLDSLLSEIVRIL